MNSRKFDFFALVVLVLASVALLSLSLAPPHTREPTPAQSIGTAAQVVSFEDPQVQKVDNYDVVSIEGCGFLSNVGEPMLPVKGLLIELPSSKIIDVEFKVLESELLDGVFHLYPAQPPVRWDRQPEPSLARPDPQVYSSSSYYPGRVGEFYGVMDGERTPQAYARIFPIQYAPATGKLIFYKKIEVTVTVSQEAQEEGGVVSFSPSPETVDYLIVARGMFASTLENFISWKESKGLGVAVENVDNIVNNFSGRDVPEKIRNCIKQYYTDNEIKWVLLVGDADNDDGPPIGGTPSYTLDKDWEVPTRYVWNPDGAGDSSVTNMEDNYTPTDYYYAGLDDNWDADDDNRFGESTSYSTQEEADWIAEVYVGRWPVRTTSELETVMSKTIDFENSPIPSENFLIFGARHGGGFLIDSGIRLTKDNIMENILPATLSSHTYYEPFPFYTVAISSDDNYIAGGGYDEKVYSFGGSDNIPLWSYLTGGTVRSVATSSDGSHMVVGSADGRVYLFDNNGTLLWSYPTNDLLGVFSVDISSDDNYIVAGTGGYSGGYYGKVYLFHRSSSTPQWGYRTDDWVLSVSISQAGDFIAAGSDVFDKKVFLFDRLDNQPNWIYQAGNEIYSVSISDDGSRVAAGSFENKLYYFDNEDNVPIWTYNVAENGYVMTVSASSDGSHVAAGTYYGEVYLFENTDNVPEWVYSTPANVLSVSISSDDNYIAAGSSGKVHFFNKSSGTPLWTYDTAYPGWVRSVSVSSDGSHIAAGGDDGRIRLFDNSDNVPIWTYDEKGKPDLNYDNVINAINNYDPPFINSFSHGSLGGLHLYSGAAYDDYENKSTESQLTNSGFLQYAFACLSNAFDVSSDVFSENIFKAPGRGAVAFVGGTRVMWSTGDTGVAREQDQDFWDNFFDGSIYSNRPGRALYGSKAKFLNYGYSLTNEAWRKNLFATMLLGDPELKIDVVPPGAPAFVWPADGENINDNCPNLDWSPVSDASPPVLYYVGASDNSQFPYENDNSGWIEDDNYQLTTELAEGTWYWRVKARDNLGHESGWSEVWSFVVDTVAPEAPMVNAVDAEPDPLIDGDNRIGENASSYADAQVQDGTYENIHENNLGGVHYENVSSQTENEGGFVDFDNAQADDGNYENLYENDYGTATFDNYAYVTDNYVVKGSMENFDNQKQVDGGYSTLSEAGTAGGDNNAVDDEPSTLVDETTENGELLGGTSYLQAQAQDSVYENIAEESIGGGPVSLQENAAYTENVEGENLSTPDNLNADDGDNYRVDAEYTPGSTIDYVWVCSTDDFVYKRYASDFSDAGVSWDTGYSYPSGLEYLTENDRIYVVDYGAGSDALIQYTTGGTEGTSWGISGYSGDAYGLAWDGSYWWIVDRSDDKVYKVDPADPTVSVADFTRTGGLTYAEGAAWDGDELWICDEGAAIFYAFDVSGVVSGSYTLAEVASFTVSGCTAPTGMAWDGENFWVSDSDVDYVWKVDNTGTILQGPYSFTDPEGLALVSETTTGAYSLEIQHDSAAFSIPTGATIDNVGVKLNFGTENTAAYTLEIWDWKSGNWLLLNSGTVDNGTEVTWDNTGANSLSMDPDNYLDPASGYDNIRVRLRTDDNENDHVSQEDYLQFYATYTPVDYRLNWEHRITGVDNTYENYRLIIYGYTDNLDENVGVYVWDNANSTWLFIDNLDNTAGSSIENTVYISYFASDNLSIRYFENTQDATATTVHIDYCALEGTRTVYSMEINENIDNVVTGPSNTYVLQIYFQLDNSNDAFRIQVENSTGGWENFDNLLTYQDAVWATWENAINYDKVVDNTVRLKFVDNNPDAENATDLWIDYLRVKSTTPTTIAYRENIQHDITGIPAGYESYTLQIEYKLQGDSEPVSVYVRNDSLGWDNVGNLDNTSLDNFTYPIDSDHIQGDNVYVRYVQPDDDATQTSLMIDYCRVKAESIKYALRWEHWIENVATGYDNYWVRVRGYTSGAVAENVGVYIWENQSGTWVWSFIDNLTTTEKTIEKYIPGENIENYLVGGENISIRYLSADNTDDNQTTVHVDYFAIESTSPALSPPHGAFTEDSTPTFVWDAVTDPSGVTYTLQIHDESTFSAPLVFENAGIPDNTYTLPDDNALELNNYYWRVRAVDGAGNPGGWSPVWQFTYGDTTGPPAPVITSSTHTDQNTWYPDADPSFEWTEPADPSGIEGYSYTIDHTSDNAPDSTQDTFDNTKSYTSLADDVWHFHVKAVDEAGNWGSTAHYTVRIDTTADDAPSVSSSTHPIQTTWYSNNDPAFSWTVPSSTSPIAGYSYVFDQNSSATPDTGSEGTATSKSYTNNVDGRWWFHIWAVDSANNWGSTDNYTVRIDTVAPSAPDLVSPADGTTTSDNTVGFDWSDSSDVSTFVLKYEIGIGGTYENTTDNTSALTKELANGSYTWRVRAYDNVGNVGDWSESRSLTVQTVVIQPDTEAPDAPTLYSPDNEAIFEDNTPTFSWSAVTDPSTPVTYTLEIDNENTFSGPLVFENAGIPDNTCTLPAENALAEGTYYWRVCATDSASPPNTSPWSSTWSLTISAAPVYDVEVSIWPENQTGTPGTTLPHYIVTVKNMGDVEDNYTLGVADDAGWGLTLQKTSVTIAVGESEEVRLMVTISDDAADGDVDNITVTATSVTDNTVDNSATCRAIARLRVVEFTFTFEPGKENRVVDFENQEIPVYLVTITVENITDGVEGTVTVTVVENIEGPVPPGMVHHYVRIEPSIVNADIKGLSARFKVSKTWVKRNNIDKGTIRVFENVDNEWRELSTSFVDEDSTYLYYEAEALGFSLFAVVGEKAEAAVSMIWALVGVVAIVVVLAIWIRRRYFGPGVRIRIVFKTAGRVLQNQNLPCRAQSVFRNVTFGQ